MLLQGEGYETITVADGEEALANVSEDIDLYILDVNMPGMSGFTVASQIRKEYEDVAVVCYINSTAELKSHSDVCVTSSNALKICSSISEDIFSPLL